LLNDFWKSEINRPLPQAVLTQSLLRLGQKQKGSLSPFPTIQQCNVFIEKRTLAMHLRFAVEGENGSHFCDLHFAIFNLQFPTRKGRRGAEPTPAFLIQSKP
jgi:hypothetical protein